MYQWTARLLLYSDPSQTSILSQMAQIIRDWETGEADHADLIRRINAQALRLLEIATLYGFDRNLWRDYLCYELISCENPFTLTCEGVGMADGSVNGLAINDIRVFQQLAEYDFAPLERALGIELFSTLTHYHSIPKQERAYFQSVSAAVRELSDWMACNASPEPILDWLVRHYRDKGVGLLGLNRAFRVEGNAAGFRLIPIRNLDAVTLDHLVGYELQKAEMRANVEAFLAGRPFNNMLLYGDAGTGKSTSVKALLNEYGERGLRMIEIYKHQFGLLSQLIAQVKHRGYRFVLFIDDLSFEENEVEYKYLKAVIEGGLETRPDNVMICATSNRRHLIRETWNDRSDMEFNGDVHRSDTLEERLSLAARFGCAVNFSAPNRDQYHDIVLGIAAEEGLALPEEELIRLANRWELRHGGKSGRTARQFIHYLAGSADRNEE